MLIGAINALSTTSRTPKYLSIITTAATIAMMTATNRNIGLARIVTPNFTNAIPIVLIMPVKFLNPAAISFGLTEPNALAKTLAF